ncbi:MAG: hypothetical protein ACHQHN_07415 [Sphingobacteriales bacterium]
MKKEKDEELDKLFKSGIEDPVNEPVYREADWDVMEQMLDKPKKRGGMTFWLPLIGSAAALILLLLGWWLYRPPVVNNKTEEHASVAKHPKGDTGTSGGATVQTADSSKHKILIPANYAQSTVHPVKKSKSFLPLSAGGSRRHTAGYASTTKVKDKIEVGTANAKRISSPGKKELITYDSKKISDKKEVGVADGKKDNRTVIANNTTAVAPDKKEVGIADANKTNNNPAIANNTSTPTTPDKKEVGTLDGKKGNDADNTIATTPIPKVKVKGLSNYPNRATFAISALASSDLNGVSSFQGSRIGGNFGGLLSMTINKWTFTTGAMYSIKPYDESYANYHTSYVFKTNPSNVGVNCRMIDIPFDVNYQVYRAHGNKITVGSGLSSYIILREDYTFNYTSAYAQGPAGYSVINKNRNILGILNLDATYEHQISSKFGIAFQPYVKLPFSNVGASQAKLQSTGVAVSLNWNLNPFKKQN